MKEHFVEAHASFGKIPDRIRNIFYMEFGVSIGPVTCACHMGRLGKTGLITLQGLDVRDAFKKRQEAAQRKLLQRRGSQRPASKPVGLGKISGAKGECEALHIETDSPILTEKQLMFEAAGGNNKDHVYSFGSHSATITAERQEGSSSTSSVSSVSSAAAQDAYIETEKRLWGYMQ
ncbi:hypothetical protein M9H77_29507 [Catharanthus roseus]|uniref:Uncharacterized protein n=1 Tax=Catharanthus roseus TaxID=4058 RepID=A0ACB9ZVN0_CATRO|nr:hypothetical protein M9H77_29507 [Catharanthus roseus]